MTGYKVSPVNLLGGRTPSINLQKVGHPQVSPMGQRVANRVHDKLDRCPCCGYGKTHNDLGVPGLYATKAFLFGGACEFFSEPCRTPPKEENCLARLWHKMTGKSSDTSCSTCGAAR
jgi:hypothetical protein